MAARSRASHAADGKCTNSDQHGVVASVFRVIDCYPSLPLCHPLCHPLNSHVPEAAVHLVPMRSSD